VNHPSAKGVLTGSRYDTVGLRLYISYFAESRPTVTLTYCPTRYYLRPYSILPCISPFASPKQIKDAQDQFTIAINCCNSMHEGNATGSFAVSACYVDTRPVSCGQHGKAGGRMRGWRIAQSQSSQEPQKANDIFPPIAPHPVAEAEPFGRRQCSGILFLPSSACTQAGRCPGGAARLP